MDFFPPLHAWRLLRFEKTMWKISNLGRRLFLVLSLMIFMYFKISISSLQDLFNGRLVTFRTFIYASSDLNMLTETKSNHIILLIQFKIYYFWNERCLPNLNDANNRTNKTYILFLPWFIVCKILNASFRQRHLFIDIGFIAYLFFIVVWVFLSKFPVVFRRNC